MISEVTELSVTTHEYHVTWHTWQHGNQSGFWRSHLEEKYHTDNERELHTMIAARLNQSFQHMTVRCTYTKVVQTIYAPQQLGPEDLTILLLRQ